MAFTVTIEKHIAKDVAPKQLESFSFETKKEANKKRREFLQLGYVKMYGDLYNSKLNQSIVTNY